MTRATTFLALLLIQALCAFVFLSDILLSAFGFYPVPISWSLREMVEIGAGFGLVIGVVLGGVLVWQAFAELKTVHARLDRASGAFLDLLTTRFDEWSLTAAERDVAIFAIKGLSVHEIAQMRSTSEGTVKAQTAAIYRKANVTGRPQLLSLFIEDMMGGGDAGSLDVVSTDTMAEKARISRLRTAD